LFDAAAILSPSLKNSASNIMILNILNFRQQKTHLFLMCCCFVFDAIHKFNGKYTELFDALFVELYTLNVHDM
ncbi:hypothetical protein MQB65_24625, partial [Escherichia coli]|uniref:hypothetical protein n=1 Tax=Escherichia coli TaxID=562 RepID=UPI002245EBF2